MRLADFKVLTFDVVGTLIDFEKGILDAFRAVGGPNAKGLTDDELFAPYLEGRKKFYGRMSEVMRDVYLHVARELDLDQSAGAADRFQVAVLAWPPFEDSIETLRRLRKRFYLVAMTNADRTAFTAHAHTLGRPFHDAVTVDETGFPKPDPRFFSYNLGRQSARGIRQDEILHVAQSQHHDIGIATELGYTVCWIERRMHQEGFGGSPTPSEVATPHYHFATLKELADRIDSE